MNNHDNEKQAFIHKKVPTKGHNMSYERNSEKYELIFIKKNHFIYLPKFLPLRFCGYSSAYHLV